MMTNPAVEAVVRVNRKTRMTITIYASLIVGIIVAVTLLSATGVIHKSSPTLLAVGFPVLALTWALSLIVGLHRGRVVLLDDTIEVAQFLWPTRRILRNDIATRYFHPGGWRRSAYHVLITREGDPVRLPSYLESNSTFQAFLADIPLRQLRHRAAPVEPRTPTRK
jgi:hypothetical protein